MTPQSRNDELSALRAKWLGFEGADLAEIHGWLIGAACAIERKRRVPYSQADALIAELRASKEPPCYVTSKGTA